jgi:hypothetical protein
MHPPAGTMEQHFRSVMQTADAPSTLRVDNLRLPDPLGGTSPQRHSLLLCADASCGFG